MKLKQRMDDLPDCTKDTEYFEVVQHAYNWTEEGCVYKFHNPTFDELNNAYKKIYKEISKNASTNYLIVYVFACHGMNEQGMQVILTNEYYEPTKFYRMFNIERKIRDLALKPNSY